VRFLGAVLKREPSDPLENGRALGTGLKGQDWAKTSVPKVPKCSKEGLNPELLRGLRAKVSRNVRLDGEEEGSGLVQNR